MCFKPKNTFLSTLFFLFYLVLSAQDSTIDSLRANISSSQKDLSKLKTYVLLAGKLSLVSFNETIKVTDEGLKLATKLNDSLAFAELTRYQGMAHYFKGDYEKAAASYFIAAGIYERRNKPKELGYVFNDIAKLYRKTKDLKRASSFYDRAYALFNAQNDSSGMQMILNESGVVFEYMGDYNKAISRYRASLKLATLLHDDAGRAWSLSFLAGTYGLRNDYKQSEDFHLRALNIRQQLHDSFAIALSYSDLAAMYNGWGKYKKAVYYVEASNEIAEKMQYKELLANNYAEMSRIAKGNGNYEQALDYFTSHTKLKDSLFSAQKTRQIEELSTLYETNKKEQQIALQDLTIKKRNQQIFFILLFVALAAVVTYLFYNRYKWQQQLKLQMEVLKQQELATSLVLKAEEKERQRIAKDLHDGVGQMMSAAKMNLSAFENDLQFNDPEQKLSFERIISLVDESCKEVRTVSHQMMPNILLKSGLANAVADFLDKIDQRKLKVSLHTEGLNERLDENTEIVLYRVLQECVNNVIKHSQASQLDIALMKDTDGISVSIEDNGKGFNPKELGEDAGIGLKNMQARINYLNGTIDFDSAPGRGTLIAIHIPAS